MTWRLAIDRLRSDRRREVRELAFADVPPGPTAEEAVDERRRSSELWRAIDALPDALRLAVILANIEGHDLAEVAALLGAPVGTIKSRLFLARKRLKEQLAWTR
jgi:RNA polymerase sigma-70 factor (ECF subfamily)